MGVGRWPVHVRCRRKKFTFAISSPDEFLLPAALRAAQACRYLIYSEADFEVFRPAGATRCTDGGEIWHRSPPPCQILPPSV